MNEVLSQDEIDQLLTALSTGETEVDSAAIATAASQRKVRVYDFKRPAKFSIEHLRTLQIMYDTFARLASTALSAQLRSMVSIHVATTDQLTYGEFLRSIPNPTTLGIINMDPLKGSAIIEIDPTVTFSIVDRLFGGKGESIKINRDLSEIEAAVMDSIIVRLLGSVRESWNQVIELRPRLNQIETNPQFAQIVPPSEMVVLITLETKVGDEEGLINFCIPYLTIEAVISKLSAQYMYSSVRSGTTTENLNMLKQRLSEVLIPLAVEMGRARILIRDILALQEGDILKIDNVRLDDKFTIKVGDQEKFFCRPGVVGKRKAVQITDIKEKVDVSTLEKIVIEGEE